MAIRYEWRGEFTSAEANALHAECFDHAVLGEVAGRGGEGGRVRVAARRPRRPPAGVPLRRLPFRPTNAGLIEL
jgi:hypothetical protein